MSSKPDNHDKQNSPKNKRRKKEKKKSNKSDDDEPIVEERFDNKQFQEMLSQMFPSKHQKEKAENVKKKKSSTNKKSKKKKSKKKEESSGEEYNPEDDIPTTDDSELDREFEEAIEEEELDTDEEEELEELKKGFQGMKFNIIFTDPRGRLGGEEWEEDEEWEEEDEEWEEEELDEDEELEDAVSLGNNIKMSKKEYALHKREEKKVTQSKFKKNERIKIKLDDWDKTYGGIVKRVHDTKKGFKYDVKLDFIINEKKN